MLLDLLPVVQAAAAVLTIANAGVGLWNQLGKRRTTPGDREAAEPAGG